MTDTTRVAKHFRELEVWQRAVDLVEAVYRATRGWPDDEKFGLTSQIRRAVVSVPSNIAEGEGRRLDSEFRQFLRIARGSLTEVETQLILAHRFGYLPRESYVILFQQARSVGRLISGTLRSLDRAISPTSGQRPPTSDQ